jgi:hypothetical protein
LFRKAPTLQEIVDVNEAIREMVIMLQKDVIAISRRYAEVWQMGKFTTVLMNLMLNPVEARAHNRRELSLP